MLTTHQIKILKEGGVAVIPTDTIYGLVGRADLADTVARIRTIKRRSPGKHFITLIAEIPSGANSRDRQILQQWWLKDRKPVSVVINGQAFRLPKPPWLQKLITHTGPLVAPSANPEGSPPAKNIKEARAYFGDQVDFYVDGGELEAEPSTLVNLENGQIKVLRGNL